MHRTPTDAEPRDRDYKSLTSALEIPLQLTTDVRVYKLYLLNHLLKAWFRVKIIFKEFQT